MQATAHYAREVIATVKSFIVQVPQTARRNILFYFKVEKIIETFFGVSKLVRSTVKKVLERDSLLRAGDIV